MEKAYDVAIIGAGSAGLSALQEVRKQTDNFVLINEGHYGTTCARVGCMPSKALIAAANAFHHRKSLARFGVSGAQLLTVDVAAVLRHVRKLRDGFVAGMLKLTDELGERSIVGPAKFLEAQVLQIGERRLQAKKVIIATGSRPIIPKAWSAFGPRLLTSDDLFEQETLPAQMAVIGLGGLGSEIAQALARLGIEITGFDAAENIAGLSDPSVNAHAVELLRVEFAVHLGHAAELTSEGDRICVSAGNQSVLADKILVALGRRPNVDQMDIENLGVKLDEHGMPPFDPRTMQIADLPVYIAGDANSHLPLLHEAIDEGHIAGYNALRNEPACFERRVPLAIIFTEPNVASVGKRLAELKENEIVIGEVDFSKQARARMAEINHGLLRIYVDKKSACLLGAEMFAPQGEHLAHLLALAVQCKLTVREILRMPFYHPVLEEGLRSALREAASKLNDAHLPDLAYCDRMGSDALD